jgi:hypothetical protein
MRWKIQLVAEVASGETTEEEIATIEREDLVSPATTGLTIAEGKTSWKVCRSGFPEEAEQIAVRRGPVPRIEHGFNPGLGPTLPNGTPNIDRIRRVTRSSASSMFASTY